MKKLAIMIVAGAGLLSFNTAKAQLGLHLNLHLGGVAVHAVYSTPPPVEYSSYDNSDDYYYMPDVEAYYSVPQHCYYYNDGGRWVSAAYLPGRYHDFDWRTARHYEIRGDRPFMHHDMYRTRYGGNNQGNYAGNRFDNRGGFDRNEGGYDRQRNNNDRNFGEDRNNYGQNRNNDNRGGQFQGGQFDNQDRRGRGQYQNQNGDNQSHNNYGQSRGNGNQYQNNGGQQPSNNNPAPYQNGNMGQGRGNGGQQPANQNGGRDRSGANSNDHFAANRMGMTRPERF